MTATLQEIADRETRVGRMTTVVRHGMTFSRFVASPVEHGFGGMFEWVTLRNGAHVPQQEVSRPGELWDAFGFEG